ncbi:50S ribosomal protein L9 [Patescibacteria group bacterium]|nr:50S ribosomal protein L9 [Patescibacteria group bacterium]MBU1727758.1 50S ribosomal protein L9 [Patescibacteria group bacterium]
MKIIFLKDVPRVGKKHDVKDVNDGYAINFLLPHKLAEMATTKTLADLERRKKEILIEKEIQEDLLVKNLEKIKGKAVVIKGRANEKGSLFSAIHKKEIVEAMKREHNAEINEEFLTLEKPIKEVGDFEIQIEIRKKKSSFKLIVERI